MAGWCQLGCKQLFRCLVAMYSGMIHSFSVIASTSLLWLYGSVMTAALFGRVDLINNLKGDLGEFPAADSTIIIIIVTKSINNGFPKNFGHNKLIIITSNRRPFVFC